MKIFSSAGKLFKSKKAKRITAIVCAVAVAAVGAGLYFRKGEKKTDEVNTAVATRGDIRVVVSGSAALEAIASYEVKATVAGDVLSCSFDEGDTVEKNQVLYTIDTTDMQNTIDRAELSMQKSRDAYNSTQKEIAKLTVKTPINGVITKMYIKEGDNVSNGAKICDVIDTSTMILTIPFNYADAQSIYAGQSAEVTLDNSFYTAGGTVKRVASGSIANENNVSTVYVEIEVPNPGGIKKGDTATAVVGDVACNSSGTFDALAEQTVTAEINGKVSRIYNDLGDQIYAGGVIAVLSSDNLNDNLRTQQINLRDAELSLKNTYDRLENYTIKAPISGTVIYRNVKAGDTLDNTASAPTLCYIADLSTIVFSLSVDELDISKIEVGQKVEIDADAVEGQKYTGYVKTVSINGSTVNGVTTYPVEIEVADPDGLIPGMNVNADIIIEEKSNVLTVPVSAVMRGNICYVKDTDDDKNSKDKSSEKDKDSDKSKSDSQNGWGGTPPSGGWGGKPQSGEGSGDASDKDGKTPPSGWGGKPQSGEGSGDASDKDGKTPPSGWGGKPQSGEGSGDTSGKDGKTPPSGWGGKPQSGEGSGDASGKDGKTLPSGWGGKPQSGEGKSDASDKDGDKGDSSGKAQTEDKKDDSSKNGNGGAFSGSWGGKSQSGDGKSVNLPAGMVPEGFHAVRVTTGANDENYIEITSGLSEGDVVYVKSSSGTTTNMFMPGMGGGMPSGGMGGMGGMGGGMSSGGNRSTGGSGGWGGQSGNRSTGGSGGWGGQSGNRSTGGSGGFGGMR